MRGYIDVLRKENLLHDLDIQLNVARETSELQALMRHLQDLKKLSIDQLRQSRYQKFRSMEKISNYL